MYAGIVIYAEVRKMLIVLGTYLTTNLLGVIFVRSSPMVLITRRPHTNKPIEIPTPPYRRIHQGVEALGIAAPDAATNHRLTNGPTALLKNINKKSILS